MKSPSLALALFFLVLCPLNASAQGRCGTRNAREAMPELGSVQRTKLLKQVRGSDEALELGSVERRALLTGKTVHVDKFHRRSHR